MRFNRFVAVFIILVMLLITAIGCNNNSDTDSDKDTNTVEGESTLQLKYSLDESEGSLAKESISGKDYTINYVFNA
ncbi:MAG: hypothetical protein J6A95_07600, partial [Clostridia bacterium]|nr:hypothetical protein [Clostridia bacterium]